MGRFFLEPTRSPNRDIYPRGSSDPFDKSFWYITKSMGYPEDTVAGGFGVPFEEAELVLIKHYYRRVQELSPGRKVVGGFMIGWGTAMLVPGPIDYAAGAAGVAVFKHPAGAIVGVAAYNLFALGVVGAGTWLATS
ncbi:MAG: hypothetical protein [Circular genetic element sp.]|nr:MAG: hypothetical protein [Circular genetic element sp.]